MDVAAGAWHSAAVSAFGDLYMWGWNVNGQMGRPVYTKVEVSYDSGRKEMVRHKMPSVFASPEVVDLPIGQQTSDEQDLDDQYSISKVCCGLRHTVVETNCGQVLGCGWNEYGQLGIGEFGSDVTQFTVIESKANEDRNERTIVCGNWSTVLVNH